MYKQALWSFQVINKGIFFLCLMVCFLFCFLKDYIILDEGHKIKNTTKTSKNVRLIPAKNHFILTGTPVQNNLRVRITQGILK